MGCSCICAVLPRLSSLTNVGAGGGKSTTLHCPQDHGKHSQEQCDTLRPEKGDYSFTSSFETDAVFVPERLVFPFVGREPYPLCHCTAHVVPPKGTWSPQLLPQKDYFKALQATLPWASLKPFHEELSKNAGCFLILASVRE